MNTDLVPVESLERYKNTPVQTRVSLASTQMSAQLFGRKLEVTAEELVPYIAAVESELGVQFSAEDKRAILISAMIEGNRSNNMRQDMPIEVHPIYQVALQLADLLRVGDESELDVINATATEISLDAGGPVVNFPTLENISPERMYVIAQKMQTEVRRTERVAKRLSK